MSEHTAVKDAGAETRVGTTREEIAVVLRDHGFSGKPKALCFCGWSDVSDRHGYHQDHRLHVAAELLKLLEAVR